MSISKTLKFLLALCLVSCALKGQRDSLFNLLRTTRVDTVKINTLQSLGWMLTFNDPDTTMLLVKQALHLSEKIGWDLGKAKSYNLLGIAAIFTAKYGDAAQYHSKALDIFESLEAKASSKIDKVRVKRLKSGTLGNLGIDHYKLGNFKIALDYYLKAVALDEELGSPNGVARHFTNISLIYSDQGDLDKALEYLFKALTKFESVGNKDETASALGNIGNIYLDLNENKKALEYLFRSLKIDEARNKKNGMANQLGNIGLVYSNMKNYAEALNYFEKAIKLDEEIGDSDGLARHYHCIGAVHLERGNTEEALNYCTRSLKMFEQIGEKSEVANTLISIGKAHLQAKRYKEAETHFNRSLAICSETAELNEVKQCYEQLSKLYQLTGNYEKGLSYYKKFVATRDSIYNTESAKKTVAAELNFLFEKKEQSAKLEQEKKDAAAAEEKRSTTIILYSVVAFLVLLLIFSVLLYNRFKLTQHQKKIIELQKKEVEEQKHLVEDKQKEIVDSINYAEKIQRTLIANHDFVNQTIPDSFVVFKPKDIVSGDFYWATKAVSNTAFSVFGSENKSGTVKERELFYLAVCDSTGHGVPGAFMSLLNISFLNEAINEKRIHEPNKVFDFVRQRLIENMSQGGRKDGMDGILVCFDTSNHLIYYTGSNNSPVLVSNGVLQRLPTDKMPVGKADIMEPFKLFSIQYKSGDMLYLNTDGYADQFGGLKGKKFKNRQLEELFVTIWKEDLPIQKQIIEKRFEDWRGDLEQVDDVTILGIKL
jgi:tetratricopeptide (TPR) repeat protein